MGNRGSSTELSAYFFEYRKLTTCTGKVYTYNLSEVYHSRSSENNQTRKAILRIRIYTLCVTHVLKLSWTTHFHIFIYCVLLQNRSCCPFKYPRRIYVYCVSCYERVHAQHRKGLHLLYQVRVLHIYGNVNFLCVYLKLLRTVLYVKVYHPL